MAKVSLWFDNRRPNAKNLFPLKIFIRADRSCVSINSGIRLRPDQWDAKKNEVVNHPQKQLLNTSIRCKLAEIEKHFLELNALGQLSRMSASDIKKSYEKKSSPDSGSANTFEKVFIRFAERKQKSTRQLYESTLSLIRKHFKHTSSLRFEDITPNWLNQFNEALAKTSSSQNYRNIHLRNIRAVFNSAIDDEITIYYPFRKYKIKPIKTRKRSMKVEDLRRLFDYPVEEYAKIYRDLFKLIFMLIGINTVDLHRLKEVTAEGRVEYCRAKTHRLYSIKVEPEAMEIINKYQGKKGLLIVADRWTDHRNFRHQINKALQLIGEVKREGLGGKKKRKPAFPEITTYWARHTWATIANDLDIPEKVIAEALGHEYGNPVTNIYIDFDQRKVDNANRKVLDWVLYGKIDGKVVVEPGTTEFYGQKIQDKEGQEKELDSSGQSALNLDAFRIGIIPKLKP